MIFIAVGTPEAEDGSADLQHVLGVARDVARAMNGYKVIVDKSTVPVGTAEKVREAIRRETTHPFSVVSNPEFLKQGAAVDDFLRPDRVVIGADDPRGAEVMRELYAPFTRTGAPIMVMDCAERRALQVRGERHAGHAHLVHERGRAASASCTAPTSTRSAARWPPTSASAPRSCSRACGYGGSCFPKDVKAILKFSKDKGYTFKILEAVEQVNAAQKQLLVDQDAAPLRLAEGQDHRACGGWRSSRAPTTCARRRRSRSSARCSSRAPRSRPTIRRRRDVAKKHLRNADHLRPQELRGAGRRRRAGPRHRVERVPRARLRPHEAS